MNNSGPIEDTCESVEAIAEGDRRWRGARADVRIVYGKVAEHHPFYSLLSHLELCIFAIHLPTCCLTHPSSSGLSYLWKDHRLCNGNRFLALAHRYTFSVPELSLLALGVVEGVLFLSPFSRRYQVNKNWEHS